MKLGDFLPLRRTSHRAGQIYISGLPREVDEDSLAELFQGIGIIKVRGGVHFAYA
jgi:RNA recognition motif-containing protein